MVLITIHLMIDTLESFSPIEFNTIKSISPIDGRYSKKTSVLSSVFSEFGLIKYRVLIEVRWLQAMSTKFRNN